MSWRKKEKIGGENDVRLVRGKEEKKRTTTHLLETRVAPLWPLWHPMIIITVTVFTVFIVLPVQSVSWVLRTQCLVTHSMRHASHR